MSTMSKAQAEKILGLTGTYDSKKLRDTYRKLAAENHPDAVAARGGDTQAADAKMKEINSANAFLQVLVKKNVTLTAGLEPGADKPAYTVYSSKNGSNASSTATQQAAQQPTGQTYSTKQGTSAQPNGKSRWAAYTAAGQNEARAEKTRKWNAQTAATKQATTTAPQTPRTYTSAGYVQKDNKTFVHVFNILSKIIHYIPLRPVIVWIMFSNLYTWQVSKNLWDNFLGWDIQIQQFVSGNPFIDVPLGLLVGLLCLVELCTGVITKIIKAILQGILDLVGNIIEAKASKSQTNAA